MQFLIFSLFSCLSVALAGNGIGPITQDFKDYLNKQGLASYNYERSDMADYGSFGGRNSPNQKVNNVPVVFIHGNSDAALTANNFSTGWTNSVNYFLANGYDLSELYATSWGNTSTEAAVLRDHDCATVIRLRKFVEAVLSYTGYTRVHIISHSMGVTLARKIIQGGRIDAHDGTCNIGVPMTSKIDVLIGIAGANYGLCNCVIPELYPTCNKKNGLYPGDHCGLNLAESCGGHPLPFKCNGVTYSKILMDMNSFSGSEASYVFSLWSSDDDLIRFHDWTWGRPTSLIPNSAGYKTYPNYTHMQSKELTAPDQYYCITKRQIPN